MTDMIIPSFGNDKDTGGKLAIICSKGSLNMAYPAFILGNGALGKAPPPRINPGASRAQIGELMIRSGNLLKGMDHNFPKNRCGISRTTG